MRRSQRPFSFVVLLSCSAGALAFGGVSCFGEFTSSVSEMLPQFDPACRNRDVFPLPRLSAPVLQNPAIRRSCKQRFGRNKRSTIRANDAIDVWNDMFSVSCNDSVQQASNALMCSQHIKQCMREYIPDDTVVPQEAVAALLGSCPTSYVHDEVEASSTLVSYQPGKTSLHEIASPAPDVVSILDSQASLTLVDFEKEMMIRHSA